MAQKPASHGAVQSHARTQFQAARPPVGQRDTAARRATAVAQRRRYLACGALRTSTVIPLSQHPGAGTVLPSDREPEGAPGAHVASRLCLDPRPLPRCAWSWSRAAKRESRETSARPTHPGRRHCGGTTRSDRRHCGGTAEAQLPGASPPAPLAVTFPPPGAGATRTPAVTTAATVRVSPPPVGRVAAGLAQASSWHLHPTHAQHNKP